MRPYYEYLIIDLPSSFNDATITACENCEELYLVYNNEILSLNNAKICYTILDQLHQREKIRFVLNKVEKSLVKQKDFEEISEEEFSDNHYEVRLLCGTAMMYIPVIKANCVPANRSGGEFYDVVDMICDEIEKYPPFHSEETFADMVSAFCAPVICRECYIGLLGEMTAYFLWLEGRLYG